MADIFAQMNNKMSGDLKKIQVTGRYFVEIWKAIGMESIDDKVSWLCSHVSALSAKCSACAVLPAGVTGQLPCSCFDEVLSAHSKERLSCCPVI